MIFRTYENDLTGFSNKLGFSKRTLGDWGNQIKTSFNEGQTACEKFKNALSAAFTASKPTYNSAGEMVTRSNIDSYMPELDKAGAKQKLDELLQTKKFVDNKQRSWDDYFAGLKEGEEYLKDLVKTKKIDEIQTEDVIAANKKCRNSIIASSEATVKHTLATKAATVASKAFAMAGNMIVMFGISKAVEGIYDISQVAENVAKKASNLGNSFKNASSDIQNYKSQIQELHDTINDSNSSIEEVTNARKNLMSIQDELIKKFGDEKESINLITQAVKGETNAWNELTQSQWQEIKNEFNESDYWNDIGNWFGGYNTNIDRMVDEMEDTWALLDLSKYDYYFSEGKYGELIKQLEKAGWTYVSSTSSLMKNGNLKDLYNEIIEIQSLIGEDAPDYFLESLTKNANMMKNTINDYGDMWDMYILHDRIFMDNDLADSWKEVNDAYTEYQNAVVSGDDNAIDETISEFAKSLNTVLDNENVDDSVKEYFRSMYPVLTAEAEKWEFKTNIIPAFDTSGLQGKTQADILEMLQTDGEEADEAVFNSILAQADEYGLLVGDNTKRIQQLLDLLVEWDILQNEITDGESDYASPKKFLSFFNSSDFTETKEKLLALARAGELSPEIIESTSDYSALLSETGLSAEACYLNIMKLLDGVERLSGATSALKNLNEAYTEFQDNGYVSVSALLSLRDSIFADLDGYDLFENIAGDPTRTVDEIQEAFNNLVTEYIHCSNTLSGLYSMTENEVRTVIENLKAMGISNAEEMVNTLRDFYNDDISNFEKYNIDKETMHEETWWNSFIERNKGWVDNLKETYGIDLTNYGNYLNAKLNIQRKISEAQDDVETAKVQYKKAKQQYDEKGYWTNDRGGLSLTDPISLYGGIVASAESQIKDLQDFLLNSDYEAITGNRINFTSYTGTPNSNSNTPSTQSFNWLETAITRSTEALDRLKQKTSDTYASWTSRNDDLAKSIAKTTEAISLQEQAASAYMQEAEKAGLSDNYKRLVQSGSLRMEDISDRDLADTISKYQDLYEKSVQCTDTANELRRQLNELSTGTGWEQIKTELDADISIFEKQADSLRTKLDRLELQGRFANESYYSDMASLSQKQMAALEKEAAALRNILNGMAPDTEAYDTMFSELTDIQGRIAELENRCIEFNNKIRSLNWEIFAYLEESLNRITGEAEFLIGLLEKSDLFDESGNITKYGNAAIGLHAANYDVYMQQAKDYYEEMQALQQQILDGNGNKDILEQYNSMTDAHRDAIRAALDEKEAILDLIEDGYNRQLDAMQKLIDKKKEQLNAEKNLYDYQKNISKQTDAIATLEKQELAYRGDNSEAAMSKIQQIRVSLEEARQELAETEYEQYLSDTESMFDNLANEFESWINERLDNEAALLENIAGSISTKSDEINSTLKEIAAANGTMVSEALDTTFGSGSIFETSLGAIPDKLSDIVTSLNGNNASVVAAINDMIATMAGLSGADGSKTNAGSNTGGGSAGAGSRNTSNAVSGLAASASAGTGTAGTGNITSATTATEQKQTDKALPDDILISKMDYYPKDKLNIDTSVVDRLKYNNKDSSWSARALYWSKIFGGQYTGSDSQNVKLLNYLKANGYKSGTSSARAGLHWTQENGDEIILRKSDGAVLTPLGRGDAVLSSAATENFYEMFTNPDGFFSTWNVGNSRILDGISSRTLSSNTNINGVDINITLPNVTNYNDFKNGLIKDKDFEKSMTVMINNRFMGKSTVDKLRYMK